MLLQGHDRCFANICNGFVKAGFALTEKPRRRRRPRTSEQRRSCARRCVANALLALRGQHGPPPPDLTRQRTEVR